MTTLEAYDQYVTRGFRAIPYPSGQKGPSGLDAVDWQTKKYNRDDFRGDSNIGIFSGIEIEPGRFLIDIDFDWPEGVPYFKHFVESATGFGIGRKSQPITHAFYTTSTPVVSAEYKDPDGTMLTEMRGTKQDGTIGKQTMAPPSMHPCGERVELKMDGKIAHDDSIVARLPLFAIFCLLAKRFGRNQKTFRHQERLDLAGFLLGLGIAHTDAILIGENLAHFTGNSVADVSAAVRSTVEKLKGAPHIAATGERALALAIGSDGFKVVTTIRKWLGCVDGVAVAIAELNEVYFLVDVGPETVVGEQVGDGFVFRSFEDFKRKHIKRTLKVGDKAKDSPVAELWLKSSHGRQYDRLVYAPPGSRVRVGANDLNGWKGFTVTPAAGSWTRTRTFIEQVVCRGNAVLSAYIFDWLAALLQRPGQHAETALVLTGKQGVGKNVFADLVVGQTFDARHARVTTHTNQVLGSFNDILSGLVYLVLDEVGLTSPAQYNSVKGLITGHTIDINRKNISVSTEPSMLHVVFLSNDDVPIRVAADDRRFAFCNFADTHQNDTAFFSEIARELDEEGGRAAMVHELLERPIDWSTLRQAPSTESKQTAKQAIWSTATWFWFRAMRDSGPDKWADATYHARPVRLVRKVDACADYLTYVAETKSRTEVKDARSDLHKELKRFLPADFDFNRAISSGGVLSRDAWTLPDWDAFTAAFAQGVGWRVEELNEALADAPVTEQGGLL